jgi:hypothetical protein
MSLGDPGVDGNGPSAPLTILVGENDTPTGPGAPTLLGVSKPVFRRWVAEGLIHPVELPGGVRRRLYRRSDLEAFAEMLAASGAERAERT